MISDRDPRIYFAAERTLLAWIRTGLAMMGFGFVVARFGLFMRELAMVRGETVAADGSGSAWAGTLLVLLGVAVNIYGASEHLRFARRFRRGEPALHDVRFGVGLASALAVAGMALAVYLVVTG